MIETIFILIAYSLGTVFGIYVGRSAGLKQGIAECIDQLIEQGYLKYKGHKNNPEILKHNEDY